MWLHKAADNKVITFKNFIINDTGEDLVAVVGSDSVNSKGMEVWNPADESLTTFHDELPHEQVCYC